MEINQLFKQHYRQLCLYALHYLGPSLDDAEDIVQECYVKMWQQQPRHEKAFLYTAVRNACIDFIRKQRHATEMVEPHDLDGAITDDEAQARSENEALLWTAIEGLGPQSRQVLLMAKRDGMSYREIASELGIAEKTVENLLSRAMKKLRSDAAAYRFVMEVVW